MKIPEKFNESRRNQNFRKTQPMCVAYKLIDLESMNAIIDARVFWPNHSMTCKAVIWINSPKGKLYGWGVGTTSGSGYHHESTAIMDAFQDMGIKFEAGEAFDGMGAGAQERAIQKIGEALGYKNTLWLTSIHNEGIMIYTSDIVISDSLQEHGKFALFYAYERMEFAQFDTYEEAKADAIMIAKSYRKRAVSVYLWGHNELEPEISAVMHHPGYKRLY